MAGKHAEEGEVALDVFHYTRVFHLRVYGCNNADVQRAFTLFRRV